MYRIANQLKPVAREAGKEAGQNVAAIISNQIATDIMDQTIRDVAHAAKWVQTVRGVGYVWRTPTQSDE